MRRASLVAAVTAAVVGVPGLAGAGNVTPGSARVASAVASVSACGTLSGIGISWTSTANVVTSVTLTSIPSGCVGASLAVTLVDSGNASLATLGPVTVTGTSQTIAPSGSATATSVTGAYVSAVGP